MFVTCMKNLHLKKNSNSCHLGKKRWNSSFYRVAGVQRIFDNGKLVVLEEGTHDITYRQPTIVGTEIIDFIDQL